jgi:phosphoglucomutase
MEDKTMDYKKMYEEWLTNPYFDAATKEELKKIAGDENEIKERFYADLEFGTAGLRGIIGAGTNRMNIYTVRKATQGLANYIKKQGKEANGVAIAYDSRRMSPEFADEAALCLCANGIKAYVFESLRPTPELSYAVRKLGCVAGINITASHNPPEYNGYKVYWEDGAQITPPHDGGIMDEVKAVTDYNTVKTMDKEAAKSQGLYQVIGQEIDDSYTEELKKQVIHWDSIKAEGKNLKIVYTPLHGTGNIPVRRMLKELGFENVYVVPEQELPDGEFPTVSYPNPEAEEAFALALKLAKEKDADLVLATDPDADRLGVYVKDTKSGEYIALTGNMSGSLLADYVIGQKKEVNKSLPKDGALIKTIVTSNMAAAIAKYYGIRLIDVLTGFKYIGQQILGFETKGEGEYLFGFEESYGCLIGTHARDKDAVMATTALCEAAAYYKTKNMTLWDAMLAMYEKYGYYKEGVKSIGLSGIEGLEKIQSIMNTLRENTPKSVSGYKVVAARDYKLDTIKNMETGEVTPTGLPTSNVLYYELENNAWLCVRPSGTEPKIKFYFGIVGTSLKDAEDKAEDFMKGIEEMVNTLV